MELTLEDGFESYMTLFESEDRVLRETDLVPGILEIADLPRLRKLKE